MKLLFFQCWITLIKKEYRPVYIQHIVSDAEYEVLLSMKKTYVFKVIVDKELNVRFPEGYTLDGFRVCSSDINICQESPFPLPPFKIPPLGMTHSEICKIAKKFAIEEKEECEHWLDT